MRKILLGLTLASTLFSCSKDEKELPFSNRDILENYSSIVYASYRDSYDKALVLQQRINTLVTKPSKTSLEVAKEAWLEAREPYGQTEAFRFYAGPIDDEDGPEGQLNAWPLDEAHIDYVDGDVQGTNIINDLKKFPSITKEVLLAQNENGGETNVALGYHAIEFLLWGQDLSEGAGAGQRPYTDYSEAANYKRRGLYLQLATEILLADLETLLNAWDVDGYYRESFVLDDKSIGKILVGLGKLSKGELAGERILVAYSEKSKEDEHSCFSDNTDRDIITNAQGIKNVFFGEYKRIDGTVMSGASISDLLLIKDPTLGAKLNATVLASVEACEQIEAKGTPFDQQIKTVSPEIEAAIKILQTQGDQLSEAATALGVASFDPSDI